MFDIKAGNHDGVKRALGATCLFTRDELHAKHTPRYAAFDAYIPQPRRSPIVETVRNSMHDLENRLRELAPRMRIAVVHGGDKEQPGAVLYRAGNTRPWKSYREVAVDIQETLQELGFQHVSLAADDMELPLFLQRERIQFAWLNTGGVQGDNSVCHAASLLEMMGVPYVGHSPLRAALLDEKDAFKRHLQALEIPTAQFTTWQPSNGPLAERVRRTFGNCAGPFIVKPVSGRASLHVYKVDSVAEAASRAKEINSLLHKPVLIETFLSGREFCVGVCGPVVSRGGRLEQLDEPFAFSPLERKLAPGEDVFTSMDKKAITDDRASLVPAGKLRDDLCELARRIYQEMDLETLVRIDVRADENGRLHVLEANPKPDLKRPTMGKTSLVSIGLPEQRMSYNDLVLGLLADRFHSLAATNPKRLEHVPALVG